ncbi:MAG: zinc finger domain-containing protein [Christensenellales bacterium]
MLEIPETLTLAKQLNESVGGKRINRVVANHSPHKFAFYHGDPAEYSALLTGKVIQECTGLGAMVEIAAENCRIVLGEGANLRYFSDAGEAPAKHQLLLVLEDGSALVCTIQMYGPVVAFEDGQYQNEYYLVAKEKPQPLTDAFHRGYFAALRESGTEKLSAKAFLATKQRIPGLCNGVLQDILFRARIHPKRKMGTVSGEEYDGMFNSIQETLSEMTRQNGRDTERDLYGNPGGYRTLLSRNTAGTPCPVCGATIQKAAYLGGSVYWCPDCQPLVE